MKKFKNNLDERQEQAMLKIEHNGCWFAFWALFVVMVAELIAFGYNDIKTIAGEWIVFMLLAIYLGIDCTRHGIFDRRLKPSVMTYTVCSALGGLVAGVIYGVVQYRRFPEYPMIALAIAAVIFVFTFGAIFVSLVICANRIKKQEEKAAEALDEE